MENSSTQFLSDIKLSRPITSQMIVDICETVEKNLGECQKIEFKKDEKDFSYNYHRRETSLSFRPGSEKNSLCLDVFTNEENPKFLKSLRNDLDNFLPIEFKKERMLSRDDFFLDEQVVIKPKTKAKKHTPGTLKGIYLLTTMVAFCSIVYELLLAQTLSSIMGDTALRYNITIGLYIASLGFGALFFSKLKSKKSWESFCYLEIILALVGGLGPIFILGFDFLLREATSVLNLSVAGSFFYWGSSLFNHLIIILVGFLSGIELPLLMKMGEEVRKSSETKVLSFDYLGSMIGAVAFPIFLVNYFHLFSVSYFVGLFNACCALLAVLYFSHSNKKVLVFSLIPLTIFLLCMIYNEKLNPFLTETLFMVGF